MSPDIDRRSDDDEDDELSGEAAEGADAVALLAADHAEIKLLFAEYESLQADDAGDDAARGELARRICQALTIHAAAEEEIFYPAAREATGEDDMVDEAVDEHAAVKELILRIENMAPSDEFFDATLRTLREVVDEHVYDEEDELFPRVLESGLDLQALGDRIAECKEELQAAFEADEP